MSWIMVGVAAASLVANQMGQAQQEKDKKQELMANAEAERYSNLTGQKQTYQGMGNTPTAAGTFASNLAAGGSAYQANQQQKQNNALMQQYLGKGSQQKSAWGGMAGSGGGNPYQPGTDQYNTYEQMFNGSNQA